MQSGRGGPYAELISIDAELISIDMDSGEEEGQGRTMRFRTGVSEQIMVPLIHLSIHLFIHSTNIHLPPAWYCHRC